MTTEGEHTPRHRAADQDEISTQLLPRVAPDDDATSVLAQLPPVPNEAPTTLIPAIPATPEEQPAETPAPPQPPMPPQMPHKQ